MARSISCVVLLGGLLALAAAAAGGCRRGSTWTLAPVEGIVTKEGRPQGGIQVIFLPDADTGGPRSSGITDEAGHYRLRTDNGDDGEAVGPYRVCLHDTHRGPPPLGRLPKEVANSEKAQKELTRLKKEGPAPLRLPSSYGRFNDTPLRVEVHPGPQVIDLEVK